MTTDMWKQWVNAILGVAIIAVPFMGLTAATLTWSLVVGGIAIAALSLWSAAEEQSPEYHRRQLQHSS